MAVDITVKPATLQDLDTIARLEAISYHPDEAASKEQLRNRMHYASQSGSELFMTALLNDEIVGFVCTSLTTSDLVTDESMSVHEPTGKTICLHSVCTSPDHREKGIATQLLRQWIDRIKIVNEEFRKEHDGEKKYNRIAMISRPALLGLYGRVGFKELGISPIIHGPDPWIDAVLDL